jgi:hypothetical protein
MNNDLINISLNQGRQFKTYQSKIKKSIIKESNYENKSKNNSKGIKENFENIFEKNKQFRNKINRSNEDEYSDLLVMQKVYDNLMTQYIEEENKIKKDSLETIKRTNKNPYSNKNVYLDNGSGNLGYVTDQGVFRWYTDTTTYDATSGKNGCPSGSINIAEGANQGTVPGELINSNPNLLVGEHIISGKSCGYEGKNVYVSRLIDNPSSSYVGCYNDAPAPVKQSIVPIMTPTNESMGFVASASSIYYTNDYGPWCAFDDNPYSFWHSMLQAPTNIYNYVTGLYEGTVQLQVLTKTSGTQDIKGEYLQITLPSGNNYILSDYELSPRLDGDIYRFRSPNNWYIIGWDGSQWIELDRQTGVNWENGNPKSYKIDNNTTPCLAYSIIVDKVGNDDQVTERNSAQIARWNLFSTSQEVTNDTRAMIWDETLSGYKTLKDCQQYAIDNGYQYFGMQDYKSDQGTAACLVSNDIARTQMYGDASSSATIIPIWSSGLTSSNGGTCFVANKGCVAVQDNTGLVIWESPNAPANCAVGGGINNNTIVATYGASCNNEGYNVASGNVSAKVNDLFIQNPNYTSFSIPINNTVFGDPAGGCWKSWDISYQCGDQWKSGHIDKAEGQNFIMDCTEEMKACSFFLILQDDGNLCLYKGTVDNNQGAVWCAMTNGQQKYANPEWVASKGKFGRNYLNMGDALYANEWIGSNDGSIRLMMQADGNLVLCTSEEKKGCVKGTDGNTYGIPLINAVYKVDNVGNPSVLGKVAYIDQNSNLREYPSSMLSKSTDYLTFKGYDSPGNDLEGINVNSMDECMTSCNSRDDCFGVVWQPGPNICYLKNENMDIKSRVQNSSLTLNVRKPLITDSLCDKNIFEIDSMRYDNYSKGELMTPDASCGPSFVNKDDKDRLNTIKDKLSIVSAQIAEKMNKLYSEDEDILNKMNMNSEEFKKNISKYENIMSKMGKYNQNSEDDSDELSGTTTFVSKNGASGGNNNRVGVEGMQNLDLNDINRMITDSDLIVLRESYSYTIWSILAIVALSISINIMKN